MLLCERMTVDEALDWGLIDEIADGGPAVATLTRTFTDPLDARERFTAGS